MTTNVTRAGRLVAVLVTQNRRDELEATLTRLLQTPPAQLAAVVVVDNASEDGTAAWLAGHDSDRLVVHRCGRNLGGAGGFETGMRLAVTRFDPDWLVLMDDDARPLPEALARFHARDRADHAAWAAAVYHPDGRICDINRPSVNPFWHRRAFLRTALGHGRDGFHIPESAYDADRPRPIDAASFVGLFVSRRGVGLAGYPDGKLFLYGEDVLYTLRLSEAGGSIAFDPDITFEHAYSTVDSAQRRFRPLWKSYYLHRNLLMVYRRAAGPMFWPALLVILPRWIARARHHRGDRGAYLRFLWRAVGDGLRARTGVEHDEIVAASPESRAPAE